MFEKTELLYCADCKNAWTDKPKCQHESIVIGTTWTKVASENSNNNV